MPVRSAISHKCDLTLTSFRSGQIMCELLFPLLALSLFAPSLSLFILLSLFQFLPVAFMPPLNAIRNRDLKIIRSMPLGQKLCRDLQELLACTDEQVCSK